MNDDNPSAASLNEATRSRAKFSGHGKALGAAGFKVVGENPDCEFLSNSGQQSIVDAPEGGFGKIIIGAAWDNVLTKNTSLLNKLLKKVTRQGIDIDLGCLYEMQDGTRGCIQAFGDMFGNYEASPFMALSGDEKTGDASGNDEHIQINGAHWGEIKRLLVYVYIYQGEHDWATIKPQIQMTMKDHSPMVVTPDVHNNDLDVCAIAMIENIKGHIRLTNHTEYFPGHAEMDRAFGFGLEWSDGRK